MRYVYMDEAGTNAKEPVAVVVGVHVHPDEHWAAVRDDMRRLFDEFVPPDLRTGFGFHAMDVFGGKDRDKWPQDLRWQLLCEMNRLPARHGLAISYGMVRKGTKPPPDLPKKISPKEFDHIMAFGLCLGACDEFLRLTAGQNELATIVAEDVPKLRDALNGVKRMLADEPIEIRPEHIAERRVRPKGAPLEPLLAARKIIDEVHFTRKLGSEMLQIADACAFTVRRWVAQDPKGDVLMRELLGIDRDPDSFARPSSFGTWAPRPLCFPASGTAGWK